MATMRDKVTAPGLSGEASGCGGVVDTTGVALGPHWARDGRPAGPAEPAGFQFRARGPSPSRPSSRFHPTRSQ